MADRRREMNGRRQDALTINMAREHAATPRRNKGGDDDRKKVRSCTTHKKKPTGGKASPQPSYWPATPHQPSHIHTPSQCCQSAGERIRRTHNKRTHRQQPPTVDEKERHTAIIASSSVPRPTE
ncbi:hypothetical protein TcCL_Unassigned01183 [Trypanosoma cruzi]|nr:hypothetical protein TcCL_Unassigned01183 [Trypanosoma cruzi]